MENENKHTVRMAFVLAVMVVALVIVSINQFRSNGIDEQQATVLHVYAE